MLATITENDTVQILLALLTVMSDVIAVTVLLWAMWTGRNDEEGIVL